MTRDRFPAPRAAALAVLALVALGAAPAAAQAYDGYYFNETDDQLYGFCADGSCAPTQVYDGTTSSAHGRVFGMAVDDANGHLYWGEGWTWDRPVELHRSDLDGSNHVLLRDLAGTGITIVRRIQLDAANGHLYFTDDKKVFRAALDGTDITELIVASSAGGSTFDIDFENGQIYYTDRYGNLFRSPLSDPSNATPLAAFGTVRVLDVDGGTGHVYFGANSKSTITRADLDGSDQQRVGYLGDDAHTIVFDAGSNKLYYSSQTGYKEGRIRAIDLSGGLPVEYSDGHEVVVPTRGPTLYMALITGANTVVDTDGDGVPDDVDVCNGDDATGDSDSDGVCDDLDVCAGDDASGDSDSDGVCDASDNCPTDSNPSQDDADSDQIGDACEADSDADGTIDDYDNCPADSNPDQADSDGDDAGDVCDPDDDNDGVADTSDNCPLLGNADQADFDADGQGDACDGDDDADGVLDADDQCPSTPMDVAFDANGCSGSQFVELAAPCDGDWANHGRYVSAVAHAANDARSAGLLTNQERSGIVRAAGQSSCGD